MVYDEVLTTEQYAMAVKKGDTSLLEVINKVLGEMKGDIEGITQKHFDAYSGTPAA